MRQACFVWREAVDHALAVGVCVGLKPADPSQLVVHPARARASMSFTSSLSMKPRASAQRNAASMNSSDTCELAQSINVRRTSVTGMVPSWTRSFFDTSRSRAV